MIQWIDEVFYPDFASNWDDTLLRRRIEAHLTPDAVILDLGAGAGIVAQMNFRGRVARVCGVDLDPRVLENPHLDEGRIGSGERLPYDDASFDLVFSDNVLEHLEDPAPVFQEVRRVLRPGGLFLAKTPNRHHYVALIARLTPTAFHRWINRRRGRPSEDTFPTRYRANTRTRLAELAAGAGLRVRSVELVEGRPEYLRLTAPTYLIGCAYERLVNALPAFAPLRVLLIACLEKPV